MTRKTIEDRRRERAPASGDLPKHVLAQIKETVARFGEYRRSLLVSVGALPRLQDDQPNRPARPEPSSRRGGKQPHSGHCPATHAGRVHRLPSWCGYREQASRRNAGRASAASAWRVVETRHARPGRLPRFVRAASAYAASGAGCVRVGGWPSSLEAASSQIWASCLRDMRTSSSCASRAHLKHSSAIARYSAAVFMKISSAGFTARFSRLCVPYARLSKGIMNSFRV